MNKKICATLALSLLCAACFPLAESKLAQAGSSNSYVLSEHTVGNGIIDSAYCLKSDDVKAEGSAIVFDDTCTENAYLKTKTKIANMKEYGMEQLFTATFVLNVQEIVEGGKISALFGLNRITDSYSASDYLEIAVSYTENLYFSVIQHKEDGEEVIKSFSMGDKGYLEDVQVKLNVTTDNVMELYVGDMSIPVLKNRALSVDCSGFVAFMQRGKNSFKIMQPSITAYTYGVAENIDYTENFDNGQYNANVFYSMAKSSAFSGSSLSVVDGQLVFKNTADAYISTRYQYSNFKLSFDLVDLQRTPVYDENGMLTAPICTFFGIGFGGDEIKDTVDKTIRFGTHLEFEAASIYANHTIPYKVEGNEFINRYVLYEGGTGRGAKSVQSMIKPNSLHLWDVDDVGDKTVRVEFSVVDGIITLQYKVEGEENYRATAFEYNLGSTPMGYVRLFVFGAQAGNDLTRAAAGNMTIDNLSIVNLESSAVKKTLNTPAYKGNLFHQAQDFNYTTKLDDADLLGNKIEAGIKADDITSETSGGCTANVVTSLPAALIAASMATVVYKKKKEDDQ